MDNKIVPIIIGVVVGVLLLGSVLIPVINDAVDDTKTYYNNDYGPFAKMEMDNVTIDIDTTIGTSGTTTYFENGNELDIPQGNRAFMVASNFTLYQSNSTGLNVASYDGGTPSTVGYASLDITIANGVVSIVAINGDTTKNYEFVPEWAFYRSLSGDYRIVDYFSGTRTVHVNSLDQVYGSNWVHTTSGYFSFNGTDVKYVDSNGTITDLTASVTVTDVADDVKSFSVSSDRSVSEAFKFTVDNDGEDYNVFPFYFVIPFEVYSQTTEGHAYSSLLLAIPVMLIIALALLALPMIRRY